jgi:periplasmic divalent cation tolerance protein
VAVSNIDARLIYITTNSAEEALRIGRALVESRLAACANILDPMTSVYWWEGEVRETQETVMIAKTTVANIDRLTATVAEIHSNDCPCVISIPIDGGASAFLDWISGETSTVKSG